MDKRQADDDGEETERERRMTNMFLLGGAIAVVVGGIWLVNALVDARKKEECLEAGRRNCNPISVPLRDGDRQ
jgi:flagellar biogenesis protein FliO